MTEPAGVLVVGASAAGLATAEALRRKGCLGDLTLLDDEVHPPYDRPPLSNQVLAGTWEPDRTHLRTLADALALRAELLTARRFVAVYRRDDRAVGVLGWNTPKQARQHRQRLLDPLLEGRR